MIDLLQYITSRYPESIRNIRIKPDGIWYSIRAVWRGERNPSFGMRWYGERWRYRDFTTHQHGDIIDFLVQVEGYSKSEAIRIAKHGHSTDSVGIVAVSARKPKLDDSLKVEISEGVQRFAKQAVIDLKRDGVPSVWSRRGFTMMDCVKLGLGRDGENGVIPILRDGKLVNVKIRLSDISRGKYRYSQPGLGSPAWYSPNIRNAKVILLLEGELNAMAAYLALSALAGEDKYGIIGMPGASQPVTEDDLEVINHRMVYVMADDDEAGRNAAIRWCDGVPSAVGIVRPLGKQDACDVLAHYGKRVLGRRLIRRFFSLEESSKSGRDGAVRSWLSKSESVRSRSIEIGKSANASSLTPLSADVVKRINYICTRFPEVRSYAIVLGKNLLYVLGLLLESRQLTAKSLAEFADLSIPRAHEIINQYEAVGLIKIDWHGRTKVARLVGNWKQVLGNLVAVTKARLKLRVQRYISIYRNQRNIFYRWIETTVQGWKWLGVHSGLVRLST